MKLNTHDRTPRPKNSKFINAMFIFLAALYYSMFGMLAFACIYYGHSIVGGINAIFIAVFLLRLF